MTANSDIQYPRYTITDAPLSWRHWWITTVASLGQLIGTAVATVAGVIIPLMALTTTYAHMPSLTQGLIGAADLMGIIVGSLVFGHLSDRYGYLLFFRLCPAIVFMSSVCAVLLPNAVVLVISLFICGFGIGGEYSLDSDYTSELMPDRYKLLMLGMVKTGAALGNILGAALSFLIITRWQVPEWSNLMWINAAIAVLMLLSRIYFFESPKWLS
ncbi:MAG: MFS transporter [Muribaculaceae bacterium]|uniref:MFS transporter n=1 Tax=Muribaculum intestinale TaxID=1796646 RepID=UPI0025B5705B|nr:MFS transporter [Muribaculum intestinale]